MQSTGVRISDVKENGVVSPTLPDVLEEIREGSTLHWSILYLYGIGSLGEERSLPDFQKEIYDSEKGFFIGWNDLNILAGKFHQIYDITIIACKDESLLQRYETDAEMYETCDIVIEMVDSGYWEVFSHDKGLIDRLAKKFKDTKFLAPDFEK